jgi:hypothetical protein
MDPELPNRDTLELANELLRERLEAQKSGIERIEAKALALLGFAAVALQFMVTRVDGGTWMITSIVFYTLGFAAGLASIALYEHEYPPDPGRLVDAYLDVSRGHLLDVLVRERAFAYDANSGHARFKRRMWLACATALTVAVTLSAAAIAKG